MVPRQPVGPNGSAPVGPAPIASPWLPPQAAPQQAAEPEPEPEPPVPGLVRLHPGGGLMRPAQGVPYAPPAHTATSGSFGSPPTTFGPAPFVARPPNEPLSVPPEPQLPPLAQRPSAERFAPPSVAEPRASFAGGSDVWLRVAKTIAKREATEHEVELLAELLKFCDEQDWTIDDVRGTLTRAL